MGIYCDCELIDLLLLDPVSDLHVYLQLGLVMGLFLAVFLGIVMQFAWRVFTKDVKVMQLMRLGIPVYQTFRNNLINIFH